MEDSTRPDGPSTPARATSPKASKRGSLPVLLVAFAVAIAVAGVSVFVLTLPPPLTIHDGSRTASIAGDFPTIFSNDSLPFSFNATTYANQTQGPASSLTVHVHGFAYWVGYANRSDGELQTMAEVNVSGHFASNLRPDQLAVACNGTGVDTYVDAFTAAERGTNVSFDPNHPIGFHDAGGDSLPVALTGGVGPGPFHDFGFYTVIELSQYRGYAAFLGVQATVTGWMLPPIRVGILLQTVYVHRVVTLFPSGQNWTIPRLGSLDLSFDPYTSYFFTVHGSLEASGPFTAYLEDLPLYLGLPSANYQSWTSGPQVTSTTINATFVSEWGYTDPYPWHLVVENPNDVEVTLQVAEPITVTL